MKRHMIKFIKIGIALKIVVALFLLGNYAMHHQAKPEQNQKVTPYSCRPNKPCNEGPDAPPVEPVKCSICVAKAPAWQVPSKS